MTVEEHSCGPWAAPARDGYLSIALAWLAIPGPRPGFIFSTRRLETTWQQWDVGKTHHGLARFAVGADGWLDEEPTQAVPRRKPCQVSSRQWEG